MARRILCVMLVSLCVCAFTACGGSLTPGAAGDATEQPVPAESANPAEVQEDGGNNVSDNTNPIVTIEIEGGGIIKLELYPDKAPNTVANFVTLVKEGFYDGVGFHRIIYGFMIQGGDPTGTGMGSPGYRIKGEMFNNGNEINDIKHGPGVISMARSRSYDSAGSQFFLMHKDAPHLDNEYCAFGKVIEGMEVVDKIAETPTTGAERSTPTVPVVMKKVTVDDKGVEYTVEKLPE